jgi:hypothetical protein
MAAAIHIRSSDNHRRRHDLHSWEMANAALLLVDSRRAQYKTLCAILTEFISHYSMDKTEIAINYPSRRKVRPASYASGSTSLTERLGGGLKLALGGKGRFNRITNLFSLLPTIAHLDYSSCGEG